MEKQAFGVCAWWGSKLGVQAKRIRLVFIYLAFATLGSTVVLYLLMAFILENKELFRVSRKRPTVWDLYE